MFLESTNCSRVCMFVCKYICRYSSCLSYDTSVIRAGGSETFKLLQALICQGDTWRVLALRYQKLM